MNQPDKPAVLHAEVSGCDGIRDRLGDAEARHAGERAIRRMERAVEAASGRILRSGGEALLAAFPSTADAGHAAAEMLQRVADLPPVSGIELSVRLVLVQPAIPDNGDGRSAEAAVAGLVDSAPPGGLLTDAASRAWLPATLQALSVLLDREGSHGPGATEGHAAGRPALPAILSGGSPMAAATEGAAAVLRLRHRGRQLTVGAPCPRLDIGRDPGAGLVIGDPRASRRHAHIEWRADGGCVLVDHSSNGTYLRLEGWPQERHLLHGEMRLAGRGRIAFAAPSSADGVELVEFEMPDGAEA